MEKQILKFEFDVGTTSRSTTGSNEDVGKALELVQRERDRDVRKKKMNYDI